MATDRAQRSFNSQVLEPLSERPQMGARVYQALLNSIITGKIESGTPLRPDVVASQLEVSTTPVREAMQQLESDGLIVKLPYQGWFVREFTSQQIQDLFELRIALERFGVKLACERITDEEVAWLRSHQVVGEAALTAGDKDAYRVYNRDLHSAIVKAARNSYLSAVMGQLRLQTEMLSTRTILIAGRPSRAFEEHGQLVELIAKRDAGASEQLIEFHISSALEDYVRAGAATVTPEKSDPRLL